MRKQTFGFGLIALNAVVWIIIAMLIWKNRQVDIYYYENS